MKSIYRLSLLCILFIGLFPIGCYRGCPEVMDYIIVPNELNIYTLGYDVKNDTLYIDSSTQNKIQLSVAILGNKEYVTLMEKNFRSPILGQSAFASKDCEIEAFLQYKPSLQQFTISCDKDLLGYPANTTVNALFDYGFYNDTSAVSQLNDSLLIGSKRYISRGDFSFITKNQWPIGIFGFSFDVKLEDGSSVQGLSSWIAIE